MFYWGTIFWENAYADYYYTCSIIALMINLPNSAKTITKPFEWISFGHKSCFINIHFIFLTWKVHHTTYWELIYKINILYIALTVISDYATFGVIFQVIAHEKLSGIFSRTYWQRRREGIDTIQRKNNTGAPLSDTPTRRSLPWRRKLWNALTPPNPLFLLFFFWFFFYSFFTFSSSTSKM